MGFQLSFEKLLLLMVLLSIWFVVLLLEKIMPHQSAAMLVLCMMITYGILIFLASLHHRRKMARSEQSQSAAASLPASSYHPFVSIVVPAHNEAAVIAETVKNLLALDYDNCELWVMDDRSSDGTADVLKRLAQEYPPGRFHYFVRPETALPGKSAVLNDALEKVQGEVIAVFDADGRVKPDFLTHVIPFLAEPGIGALQVRKAIANSGTNLLTRCQHHEYLLDAYVQTGRDIIHGAVELRGNGQLIKRAALESVGGWTEETITDDLDLSTKLHLAGWDIRFLADATVEEEGIIRFKPLLKQRRRWAEGSLKRYLEYSVQMFTSPYISYRATMDMLAYFMKFLFPIWVATDFSLQILNLLAGEWPNHLISSLIVLPAMGVFFVSGLFLSIRHHERANPLQSLVWSVETAIYMLIIWVPVVMWITAKVLLSKDEGPLNWGKTEHLGTQAHIRASRLERLKSLLQRSGN